MSDIIFLNGMRFMAIMERFMQKMNLAKFFIVDVTLKVDLTEAGKTDNVKDTVHYGEVFEDVKTLLKGHLVN